MTKKRTTQSISRRFSFYIGREGYSTRPLTSKYNSFIRTYRTICVVRIDVLQLLLGQFAKLNGMPHHSADPLSPISLLGL